MNRRKSFLAEIKVALPVHVDHEGRAGHAGHGNPGITDASVNTDKCAAVQTKAIKQRQLKPPKTLKVSSIADLEIGPKHQLTEQQRSDETPKRYWELADKPSAEGKPQFVVKKGILCQKQKNKSRVECKLQLVVPVRLRHTFIRSQRRS